MIEERYLELIHAELDGELTAEQRAELSRLLLANPEARAFRDQLNRLFGELAKLEDVAPPSDLSASVLGALRIPAGPEPSHIRGRAWYAAPAFRYAAVFVGGLLASALLFGSGARHGAGPAGKRAHRGRCDPCRADRALQPRIAARRGTGEGLMGAVRRCGHRAWSRARAVWAGAAPSPRQSSGAPWGAIGVGFPGAEPTF